MEFLIEMIHKTAFYYAKIERNHEIVKLISEAKEKARQKESRKQLEAFKEEHNKQLEAFKEEHKRQLEAFKEEHNRQLEAFKEEHKRQIEEKDKEIQKLMDMIKMLQNQS